MLNANKSGFFPYTPATNMLQGLAVAIDMLHEEGLENVFARHDRLAEATRRAVRAWGLEILCRDAEVLFADHHGGAAAGRPRRRQAARDLALEHFDISLGTSFGKFAGKVFRIGHLGDTNDLTISARSPAIEMALALAGVPHQKGGVQAAMDYHHLGARRGAARRCRVSGVKGLTGRMAFTLYNAPQSTCSQRVRFVLNAKSLAFEEKKLDLLAGDQLKPDYLALNPNGVVPTLVHDGDVVIDSSVIIEYLDEIAPDGESFTPREPGERARMRSLMRFIDEMPAAAVRVPTFNLAFLPRFAKMSEEEFLAFAESKPLRKEFMLAMGRTGFPEKDMNASLDRMRRTYERMDAAIAQSGGPFLQGARPTLADVSLMPALVRMDDLGLAGMWADRPAIGRWYAAIRAHPAFRPTYYTGSLLTEIFPHLREKQVARAG